MIYSSLLLGVILGFEETILTVNEEDGVAELCVNVFQPPAIDPNTGVPVHIDDINIIVSSHDDIAGSYTAGFK